MSKGEAMGAPETWEVIVVGAGLAGLSAAIYLARAKRRVLVIDEGRSLALWEPDVQNYLGFPEGIGGEELLRRGKIQAQRYGARFIEDKILGARQEGKSFVLTSGSGRYVASRVLLATGLFHLPPEIPGVEQCLGRSLFFCKDCDAYRVQGKRIGIVGRNNEAVRYALGMLPYTPRVVLATNGKPITWDASHESWLQEYQVPVFTERILQVEHSNGNLTCLLLDQGKRLELDAIFTTRGDVYHNALAQGLGAKLDSEGQVLVDELLRTTVLGLYAAGCVTPANCQMIIAAGQGATAAQAINRELFEESFPYSLLGWEDARPANLLRKSCR
jgi:thioredoxin reductase (NADPH)